MLFISTLLPMTNPNHSFFGHTKSNERSMILIYVDDFIVTGDNNVVITNLKRAIYQKFVIKDLGVLQYLIGVEIATSHKRLFF